MSAEAAAVARRAAEIIQERGQAKGRGMDPRGQVCLWGSITLAADEVSQGKTYYDPLYLALSQLLIERGEVEVDPIRWNDKPTTDETDVAKVLLQVADRLEVAS